MSGTKFTIKRDQLKVEMERVYDAPLEVVFNAFVDSDLISRWWGPRGTATIVDKNDVEPGGAWRFIVRNASGKEDSFSGKYVRVSPPDSVTRTFNYDPIGPGHELTETAEFESLDGGKTRLRTISEYKTIEELDGMVASGMERGATESFDRLGELLEIIKTAEKA